MAQSAFVSGDVFPVDGTVSVDFTKVDTVASYNLTGAPVMTNKGPAIYALVGTAGFAAGDYGAISQSITTGIITATGETTTTSGAAPRQGVVAIATCAALAYAWFLTGPFDRVPVNVANSVASGAALTTTGTIGQLGAGGDTVVSMYCIEASAASVLTSCSSVQEIGSNI